MNKHIWENYIKEKPTIYALEFMNFFPSVTEELAVPAIAAALKKYGIKKKESNVVINGLKVVRTLTLPWPTSSAS